MNQQWENLNEYGTIILAHLFCIASARICKQTVNIAFFFLNLEEFQKEIQY